MPSVTTSAPAASSRSASFGVSPAPSAAFSPLTTQKSTPSSSRRAGSRVLDRPPPGRAEHVGEEEEPQRCYRAEAVAAVYLERTWLPASCVYARERLPLDRGEVEHVPIFERHAATGEPTVSAGSVRRRVTETTSAGSPEGWISIREPKCVRSPLIT